MKQTLIALCLILIACGGGKADNPKIRIATVGPGMRAQFLAVPMAQFLGYFRDEGLDVSIEALSSNAKTMQALIGGSVEAASLAYSQALQVAAEGQHVRTFFFATDRVSNALVTAPSASERIRSLPAMKGKLLGVPSLGSGSHLWAENYLAGHGVGPVDYTAVNIGITAAAVAALENGRVDAGVLAAGEHIRYFARNPSARLLVDGTTTEAMREVFGGNLGMGGAVGARQDWLDRNPETARRLARALRRTHLWLTSHTPEEIRERLPADFRSAEAAIDLEVIRWNLRTYTPAGRMPDGGPEAMRKFLATTNEKLRDVRIDLAATWTNEFLPEPK